MTISSASYSQSYLDDEEILEIGSKGAEYRADALSKRGSLLPQPDAPLPYSTAKRLVDAKKQSIAREGHEKAAAGKQWDTLLNNSIPKTLPRRQSVACFRIQSGHDFLAKHLNRICIYDSPICTLCLIEDMTSQHLDTCPALQDISEQIGDDGTIWYRKANTYWAARERMAAEPRIRRN
ncbi:hypothetical protein GE061_012610 [Apolygus lucorum]|uniref:Uncharacterized protein n=1 Tax=Apolygus lucorum TaxID=248454 RepID=A0A8S9XSV1_APOLU|nr:hypothetical protein GE061_012610 [Apolygus lucorum]